MREHNRSPKGRLWAQIDGADSRPAKHTTKRRQTGFVWRAFHTRRKHPLPPMLDRAIYVEGGEQ